MTRTSFLVAIATTLFISDASKHVHAAPESAESESVASEKWDGGDKSPIIVYEVVAVDVDRDPGAHVVMGDWVEISGHADADAKLELHVRCGRYCFGTPPPLARQFFDDISASEAGEFRQRFKLPEIVQNGYCFIFVGYKDGISSKTEYILWLEWPTEWKEFTRRDP